MYNVIDPMIRTKMRDLFGEDTLKEVTEAIAIEHPEAPNLTAILCLIKLQEKMMDAKIRKTFMEFAENLERITHERNSR